LTEILVVGHSAGGQAVQRYALATTVDSTLASLNISLRYVAENAGSYAYLNTSRAVLPTYTSPTCAYCNASTIPSSLNTFSPVDAETATSCPDYNDWKYGLLVGLAYVADKTPEEMTSHYKNKDVTYVLGTLDTCNDALGDCWCIDHGMDTRCGAELQGYCRYQRGWVYFHYLNFYYHQSVHSIAIVPGVGHDDCEMITSNVTVAILFRSSASTTSSTSALSITSTTSSHSSSSGASSTSFRGSSSSRSLTSSTASTLALTNSIETSSAATRLGFTVLPFLLATLSLCHSSMFVFVAHR